MRYNRAGLPNVRFHTESAGQTDFMADAGRAELVLAAQETAGWQEAQ